MSSKRKNKYYVVWNGHRPGIYNSWTECQLQIKNYPNAQYKSFKTEVEAKAAYDLDYENFIDRSAQPKRDINLSDFNIEKDSISVDAACSGNPGDMEYRAVVTTTGEEIFRKGPFKKGTNNIGEFLALVHALAWLKKKGDRKTKIYTDSRTAISWLRNKRVKTNLAKTHVNQKLFEILARAEQWTKTNKIENEIQKFISVNNCHNEYI